jgi:hypothetical protein
LITGKSYQNNSNGNNEILNHSLTDSDSGLCNSSRFALLRERKVLRRDVPEFGLYANYSWWGNVVGPA